MKSKNTLSVIVFFLIINTALAVDLRPEIEVTFDEIVDESTININLTDQSGAFFDLIEVSSNNPIFKYRPAEDLPEGFYTVRAQAKDLEGTLGPVIELGFLVQIPPIDIILIEPSLGVSPITQFDFSIRTDRWANCKYAFLDRSYDDMASTFNTNDNLLHEKTDFTTTGKVYVKCKGEYNKITPKSFDLSVDASPPDITYKHADDATEFPIETTLIVRTNDKTVCKYYIGSEVDYSEMNSFPDYDESDENSYKTEHQQILDENHLIDYQVNRVYIRCKNKAELLSVMEYVDINVDTTESPLIVINAPKRYIADTTPLFDVTTNKDSICRIADNSNMDNAVSMGGVGKDHTKELTNALLSGTYTYYIECIFAVEGAIKTSVTFTIDDSAPTMLYINMLSPLENRTDKTYKDDELCAEWKAEDSESSILLYAYYVYWDKTTDELIEDGTKSPDSDDEYCINVELNDSQKYYIEVSAQNAVGLWSNNLSSSSIEVDTSLAPAGCNNYRKDGDETDIDCGGSCEDCANGKDCLLDSDCDNNYCNSSNKCATPSCNDGVRNGAETDVDCGGNCKKCDVGKFCNKDKDCKTNNCDASTGKCAAILDKCENNQLDPAETDVDCGGVCPACGIGKNCDSDSDCISAAECKDGICKLDSDSDGIVDDEDNCPDIANEDQADIDDDDIGDACDTDSDNDGLPDSFEQQYFGCVTCADPNDDPDKDGLTNLKEAEYNTNPTKKDTDGDGYGDKEEIDKGYDPLDPSSHPAGSFWKYLLGIFGLAVLVGGGYLGYKMFKKKKPFPPRARAKRIAAPRRMRPMMKPMIKRPMMRPKYARPPITKKPIIKKALKVEPKTELKQLKKEKEENIFNKLSKIAEAEKVEQVEKHMQSLKLTDKDLKGRIGKLRKELKIK